MQDKAKVLIIKKKSFGVIEIQAPSKVQQPSCYVNKERWTNYHTNKKHAEIQTATYCRISLV